MEVLINFNRIMPAKGGKRSDSHLLKMLILKIMLSIDLKYSVLLEIDLQNDFCPAYISSTGKQMPAGALSVESGDKAIPPLNKLAAAITAAGGRVAASQDWHPPGHVSFASAHPGKKAGDIIDLKNGASQVLWPDHCVQGRAGAAFHEGLNTELVTMIIRKGFRAGLDSYSAFFENDKKTPTGLEGWLRGLGIKQIIIGGLATDYCVFYSVTDALNLNFQVIVVSDAVLGVDYPAGSTADAIKTMKKNGAVFLSSNEIIQDIKGTHTPEGALLP